MARSISLGVEAALVGLFVCSLVEGVASDVAMLLMREAVDRFSFSCAGSDLKQGFEYGHHGVPYTP
jgi:hypothetical protein